jgi:uncharacterized membrane protein
MIINRYFLLKLILFVVLLLTVVANWSTTALAAPTIDIRQVDFSAEILSDGSMKVIEKRTVHFYDLSRGTTIFFLTADDIKFSNITVREDNLPYREVEQLPTSEPGTYAVEKLPDRVEIDWSYRAEDETRVFILEYTVHNAVIVHTDTAELYYQFIGDGWTIPTGRVNITLTLPPGAEQSEIKAWGHGAGAGKVEINSPTEITWFVSHVPAGRFLEARVTFPPELVPGATRFSNREGLPKILREEKTGALKANLFRQLRVLEPLISLLMVIPFGLYYLSLKKRALIPTHIYKGNYYRDLPGDYPPETAGFLWYYGKPRSFFLTAGILNLAYKGLIRIEEIRSETARITGQIDNYRLIEVETQKELIPSEKQTLKFFFETVYDYFKENAEASEEKAITYEKEIKLSDINLFARRNPKDYEAFYSRWHRNLDGRSSEYNFFAKFSFGEADFLFWLLMIIIFIISFYIWHLFFLSSTTLILGLLTIIFFPRRWYTSYGTEQITKWKAFRRYLLDFSQIGDSSIPSLAVWEHYLVYAVALGFADRAAKQLVLADIPAQASAIPDLSEGTLAGLTDFSSLIDHVESVNKTFTKTFHDADEHIRTLGLGNSSEALDQSPGFFASLFSSDSGGDGSFFDGGGGGFGGGGGSFR